MKKKTLLLLAIPFLQILNITAQSIQWQKSLGGSGEDRSYSIQQTLDGGYIITGITQSNNGDVTGFHGSTDNWVVKLNSAGAIDWQKALGGVNSDYGRSIQQTSDKGYIVAGFSNSTDGDVTGNQGGMDYWIVKLDSTGTINWQKSLGGTNWDGANSIQQTADGGYIVAGESQSNDGDVTGNNGGVDYWVVKLDSTGNIDWQKTLGGTADDRATSIKQTSDGGYIVAGWSASIDGDVTGNNGYYDYWVVKLDSNGTMDWEKSFGGTDWDQPNSIQQTSDNGYVIAGYSQSNDGDVTGNNGDADYWVVKIDSIGNIDWQKCLGGTGNDIAYSIQQTTNGEYIVCGFALTNNGDVTGNHGGWDYWVVSLDSTGTINWQKSLGGIMGDVAYSIQQTSDGGYVVAGYSGSNDGDVTGNNGGNDFWIVKLSSTVGIDEISEIPLFNVFPNPSSNQINVKVAAKLIGAAYTIYDNIGKIVLSGKLNTDNTIIELNNLSGGIYFFNIGENRKQTFKVIKE